MVFQSLLSTASSSSATGFFGGGFSGSPPDTLKGGVSSAGGVSKDSFLMGSVRTFDEIPAAGERAHRRPAERLPAEHSRGEGDRQWDEAQVQPTFGWWRWRRVEEGPAEAGGELKPVGATLHAIEQSLSSWEKDANEKFNHWQHAEEIKPLCRSSSSYGTYGTFTRQNFLYSAAACAPTRAQGSQDASAPRARSDSTSASGEAARKPGDKDSSSAQSLVIHTLRPGDTLSALAVKYQVQVNDIARANGISGFGSHASLLVRKSLRIPVLAQQDAGECGHATEVAPQAPAEKDADDAIPSSGASTRGQRAAQVEASTGGGGYQSAHGQRSEQAHAIAARLTAILEAAQEPAAAVL